MKKIITLLTAIVISISLTGQDKSSKTETSTFLVTMSCASCKAKIEKNIPFEKGVKDLSINLENKTVAIQFDPSKTDNSKLIKAIEKLGYKAEIAQSQAAKTEPEKIE